MSIAISRRQLHEEARASDITSHVEVLQSPALYHTIPRETFHKAVGSDICGSSRGYVIVGGFPQRENDLSLGIQTMRWGDE